MNDNATRDTRQIVALGLLVASVLIAVLVLVKVAGFYLDSAEAQDLAQQAAAQNRGDTKDVAEHVARSKTVADGLKQKNLFAPPLRKEHPVKAVQGILGSDALINGKLYAIGDNIGSAKIVAVGSTTVTIEWEGQTKEFAPIAAATGPASARVETPKPAEAEKPVARTQTAGKSPAKAARGPANDDLFSWLGVEIPASLQGKILEKWSELSDDQKAEARKEWGTMSGEQKKQALDQWKREL